MLPTVHVAPAKGWADGDKPVAAAGLTVTAYATGLDHPRWLTVLPNGDVLVAETNAPPKPEDGKGVKGWVMKQLMKRAGAGTPSADRITLLRGVKGDGTRRVAQRLPRAPALAVRHGAGRQRLLRRQLRRRSCATPTVEGATRIDAAATTVTPLPAGPLNHHWTKNVIASSDGAKLYATVGSNSNVAENGMAAEEGRAAIWEIDRKSGASHLFATGLRNPNGMAWGSDGTLWTVANERDELGSDLVPDYLTSVREGAFYGWPYSYYGQHVDERAAAAAPRPGRQGGRARLRARPAHGVARPGVVGGRDLAGAVQRTACSSASTARGTATRRAATRSSSCRSRRQAVGRCRSTC